LSAVASVPAASVADEASRARLAAVVEMALAEARRLEWQ